MNKNLNESHLQNILKKEKKASLEELQKKKLNLEIQFLEKQGLARAVISLGVLPVLIGSLSFFFIYVVRPLSEIDRINDKLDLAKKEETLSKLEASLNIKDKIIAAREFSLEQ
ncbi:MAG: hypothetical protein AB8G86_00115 [Saprospiraceae bacterium]